MDDTHPPTAPSANATREGDGWRAPPRGVREAERAPPVPNAMGGVLLYLPGSVATEPAWRLLNPPRGDREPEYLGFGVDG